MKKIIAISILAAAFALGSCGTEADVLPMSENLSQSESDSEALPAAGTVTSAESTTAPKTETTKPKPQYATVSVAAVGDNLIHSSIYNQAHARAADGGYDFEYAYENVKSMIRRADLAIINQETLICNGLYEPSSYPRFNSPPELGDYMLNMGFDVFTIANNHTLDKDADGLAACLDYWDSRDSAVVCGAYRNAADRADIRTADFGGITFSFLSYTESLNGLSLPAGSEMSIGDAYDIDTMISEIEAAEKISDVTVVALHWGVENSDIISDYQRTTAKQLADAGADIIIGNHPHVLRDIEEIEREDGSAALCAYSLGNFISAQSVGQNLIGGILEFNVSIRTDENADPDEQPVIGNIELIPIITHYDGNYHDIRIYPLSEYSRELAESHGVKNMSKFGYDYIFEILKRNISDNYWDPDDYYEEE